MHQASRRAISMHAWAFTRPKPPPMARKAARGKSIGGSLYEQWRYLLLSLLRPASGSWRSGSQHQTTIHTQHRAVDKASLFGSQEQVGVRNILRAAGPASRRVPNHLIKHMLGH